MNWFCSQNLLIMIAPDSKIKHKSNKVDRFIRERRTPEMLICQQFIIETLIGNNTVAGHKEFIGNYDIQRFKLVSLSTLPERSCSGIPAECADDKDVQLLQQQFKPRMTLALG